MRLYLITDALVWHEQVEVTETEADRIRAEGYTLEPLDPTQAKSFAAFASEYLDEEEDDD